MAKFDAMIYSNNNSVQRRDAADILNSYLSVMNWSHNDTIMDVGTGDGTVLLDIILQKIPKDFQKVVALDISEDMLSIARDIATKSLPLELQENFDHVFSLYCLHWVADRRQTFENIFKLLKPGGDILVTIVVDHVVANVYETMSRNKWENLISNFKDSMFSYRNFENVVPTVQELLEIVGFVEIKCEVVQRTSVHDNFSTFREWALGINPFMKKIPQEDVYLFKEEFLSELKKVKNVVEQVETGEKIHDSYPVLVICASKPVKK